METKLCTRCKEEVSTTLFRKRTASKDGLHAWCTPCCAAYDRERYLTGDNERKNANKLIHRERVREQMWEFLCNSKCQNCGNNDPEVLEFDHRDGVDKEYNVSEMVRHHSWAKILLEIAKCDILCANCHRKRTIRQGDFWRGRMVQNVDVG